MAANVLVSDQLSDEMVSSGAELLRALDRLQVNVKAAFWLLFPEERTWRFVLVSPEARTAGPRVLYGKVASANKRLPDGTKPIATSDVAVADDRSPIYGLLKAAIGTGPRDVGGIRFTANVINGRRIDDAYIYRMS